MGNEINKASTATLTARGVETDGFKGRLFGYFMFYIPVFLGWVFLLFLTKGFGGILDSTFYQKNIFGHIIFILLFFSPPTLLFVLWERSIRKFRRANGLSVYGNIREELEQREIDERVRKEHKAFVANGIVKDGSVDKNDIGYWFGLLKDGAITQEEYDRKKAELM